MEACVHLKIGDEIVECATMRHAASYIKQQMRWRKLDAFVMAFWDEGESNSRPRSLKQQKSKSE